MVHDTYVRVETDDCDVYCSWIAKKTYRAMETLFVECVLGNPYSK